MSNDVDGPLSRFSRSRHFYLKYLKYRAFYGQSFYRTLIGNHAYFQCPVVTSDPDFKVTTFFEVEYRKNGES